MEELKDLRRGIQVLEKCSRNLERKAGYRDDDYEEEYVSEKEEHHGDRH